MTTLNPVTWLLDRRAGRQLERNFVWITPQLVQGARLTGRYAPLVAAMGIGSVLDLRAEAAHDGEAMAAQGLHYHRVPMNEFDPPTLPQLEEGAQWVLSEMAASRAVLVHCRLGISRSVCVACAVLIGAGQTFEDAFRVVRSARPGARLTEGQLICLAEFANQGR